MRDPYLYEGETVLKNKLDIHDQDLLNEAEADYVSLRLRELVQNPLEGDYYTYHFFGMHEYIFQDLYSWAGEVRIIAIYKEEDVLGGLSVEYDDPLDIISNVHNVLSEMRQKLWGVMDKDTLAYEFCESLAKLWKIHPFREGNTRVTITFCCQFIEAQGIKINRKLFEKNSRYVRTALVAYNAFFANGDDYSKKEYLYKIVRDSIE